MNETNGLSEVFSLSGKVALITGAARGLGFGYAEAAAAAGAHVVISDSDSTGLANSLQKLLASGYSCSAVPFNVTSPLEVTAAIKKIILENKKIDILVNNAGNQLRKPFIEFTLEEWNSIMDVHVKGSFLVTQEVARHMIQQKNGSIIMIGSIVVNSVRGTISAYTAAKGAVTALAKAIAVELGPIGIRCNVIAPGMYETEFNRALINKPEIYETLSQKIPLKRWGKPADIAPTMVYLASDAGRYINGQIFTVDGGLMATF